MKRVYTLAGWAVLLGAGFYFFDVLFEHASELSVVKWNIQSSLIFCGCVCVCGGVIFLGGLAWHLLLRSSGQKGELGRTLTIFAFAQFGKYLPGNIAQHIGRVSLAKMYGFDVGVVILTMALETAWVILASAGLGAVSLILIGENYLGITIALPSVLQLTATMMLAVAVPIIGYWVLMRWRGGLVVKVFKLRDYDLRLPKAIVMVECLMAYTANLLLMGLNTYVLARGIFGVPEGGFLALSGVFAIAWIAGFLAPGAPAGLGVREAILVAILSQSYGPGTAAGLAILLRAVGTVADGVAFAVAAVARRKLIPYPPAGGMPATGKEDAAMTC